MKKGIIYITVVLVVLLLIIRIYSSLSGSHEMDYSIILDKKEVSQGTEIKVYQDGEEKTLLLPKSIKLKPAPAYKIETKDKTIISISPIKYNSGKILSIDDDKINLKDKTLTTTDLTKYYKVENKSLTEISDKGLIVGYQGYRFIMDKKDNVKMVICSIPKINRIRTLISNSDFSSASHKEVKFSFEYEAEIDSKDLKYKFAPKDVLVVKKQSNSMILSLLRAGKTTSIGTVKSRLQLIQGENSKISMPSNTRENGYIPSYYGSIEIFANDKHLNVINEAYIDDYLKGVVPSEMPSSGGSEGYKIQSIVNRTNAINNIHSKEYASLGVHVLDSGGSPLYEASPSNTQSNEAIDSTSGEIMTYNGEVIDAKYFSTSPGFRSSYEDVFGKVSPARDYLNTLFFDESSANINLTNEESITSYLKDWTAKSYDSNSQLFRWKYSVNYADLSKMINANIFKLYNKNPDDFEKKWYFFIYKKTDITKDGIGKIKDISISKRNSSGMVEEIKIDTDSGTFKVKGSYNLKRLFIPEKDFELSTVFGNPVKSRSSIPSLFFTIEKNITEDKFKSITIYGGGDGDAIGLSKYGAIGLARTGKDYKHVLSYFYPGTKLVNLNEKFRLEVENRTL